MAANKFSKWESKDAWSLRDFIDLLCGIVPDKARQNTDEINEAREDVIRAVSMGKLHTKDRVGKTQGDVLYETHVFFDPQEAIAWAAPKFPKFPFKDVSPPQGEETSEARKKRIKALINELKSQGVRAFLQTAAAEEGVSVSRIKQIVYDNPTTDSSNSAKNPWAGLRING
jgi:hypothetical protein